MKYVRKTCSTLAATVAAAVIALLLVTFVGAACSDKVTLRFETDGGTYLASVEGEVGSAYPRPAEPEKEGFYFDGWYLSADFSGERQELPDVMPSESAVYYAKYAVCPILTVETAEGRAELSVKPGSSLEEALAGRAPERAGLSFGGWFRGEEALPADAKMPGDDLAVTARYLASYEVNVFLQAADDPERFVRDETLSRRGSDWEGNELRAELPSLPHFELEDRSVLSRTLAAGENELALYFAREEAEAEFVVFSPEGETRERTLSRYGARLTLPDAPSFGAGKTFFGWSEREDGSAAFAPGETVVLDAGKTVFYGCSATVYPGAHGEGTLSVADVERADGSKRAVFSPLEGAPAEGSFAQDGTFEAGELGGRLDGFGCFLRDDSGVYAGIGWDPVPDAERYGTLALDFGANEATYTLSGEELSGRYRYEYDEESGRYTGYYVFEGQFRFRIVGETFRREGEEKGEYALYGSGNARETLELDGFGGAKFRGASLALSAGAYAPFGEEEWQFSAGENSFRFRLGAVDWGDGSAVLAVQPVFLKYRTDLGGQYVRGEDVLRLDGYGLEGAFLRGEETVSGPFERDGVFVTLHGEEDVRFTLSGESFFLTSAEGGTYDGARGTLFLDGGSGAKLLSKSGAVLFEGTYEPFAEGEWTLERAGETEFRFRLSEGGYDVFSDELFGEYGGHYGVCLVFDGYGGGIYRPYTGSDCPFRILYADGKVAELSVEDGGARKEMVFALNREKREAVWIQSGQAGRYFPRGPEKEILVLGGFRGDGREAELIGEETLAGTFREGELFVGERVLSLRLFEEDGVKYYLVKGLAGTFGGPEGPLALDGFGEATFGEGEERFSAPYSLSGGQAEMVRGGKLYRFALEGEGYALTVYARYLSREGEELCISGDEGFLRGEAGEAERRGSVVRGETYSALRLADGEVRFRLYGGTFARYDEAKDRFFSAQDGTTLDLDGCGFAFYASGKDTFFGEAELIGETVVFRASGLPSLSGALGFTVDGERIVPLGGEFGAYAEEDGKARLELSGDGKARYFDGTWRTCEYEAVSGAENEFALSIGLRVRLGTKDGAGAFLRRDEALAENGGRYGDLVVDGYGVFLGGEKAKVLYAGKGFLALAGEEGSFGVLLEEGGYRKGELSCTLRLSGSLPENFTEL